MCQGGAERLFHSCLHRVQLLELLKDADTKVDGVARLCELGINGTVSSVCEQVCSRSKRSGMLKEVCLIVM